MDALKVKPGNVEPTVITGTTAVRAPAGKQYKALQMADYTVIAALESNAVNPASLYGKTLPPGFILYGEFQSVTLTSGTLIAYRELQ